MTGSIPEYKRLNRTGIRWLAFFLLVGAAVGLLLTTNRKQEAEFTISPTFVNLAEDLFLPDAEHQKVRVLISGSPSTIDRLNPTAIHCIIDLSGLRHGSHTIQLKKESIVLPDGAALSKLAPPSLALTVEKHPSRKEVDVVAALEGKPAPGYAVADVLLKPSRIILKGPASELMSLETVKTKPIDIEAASESFKKEVPLDLQEVVSATPSTGLVIAQVEVRERLVTRVIENLPVSGKGLVAGYRIEPERINLTLNGPEGIVKTIENDPTFAATIDLTELSAGTHLLKATINLPVRVKLIEADPEQFEVEINE